MTDIHRYSISQDKIDLVSSLPVGSDGGLPLRSKDGKSIYYFGGDPKSTLVHKFNIDTSLTVQLGAPLPQKVYFASGISLNGAMFLFDGRNRNVLEFSEDFEAAKVVGDLPFQPQSLIVATASAIPDGEDGVWLLAGNNPKPMNPILFFNTTSKVVSIPSGNTTTTDLPTLYYAPSAVWDGLNNGYLIGGLGVVPESNGSTHASNGILR
jgi:hypothetical protein